MGTKSFGELVNISQAINIESLNRKVIALDTFNILYQFLAAIRGEGGRLLTDSEGKTTSHLEGLFYRTMRFLKVGIKPVYIFDGKPNVLKLEEIRRRSKIRKEATVAMKKALLEGDEARAAQLAQRTSRIGEWEIESSKRLIKAMGLPYIQAPSEAEAQSAVMNANGDVYASGTQDYDTLLFGAPVMIRNLTLSGRRKLPNSNRTIKIDVQTIQLDELLEDMKMSREELIDLSLLLGTDFNPDGFRGIGPKTALKLVRQYGTFEEVAKNDERVHLDYDIEEIRKIFLKPDANHDLDLKWQGIKQDKIIEFLVEELSFNEEKIKRTMNATTREAKKLRSQTALDRFF